MKLKIEQSAEFEEVEINIKCSEIDANLREIIDKIQLADFTLKVQKNGNAMRIKTDKIYYIESVDNNTYVYCEKEVYSSLLKLYELDEKLSRLSFVRISKSCLLNIDCLESVCSLLNGKMEGLLSNGEKIIINRHYVPLFKKKFGL